MPEEPCPAPTPPVVPKEELKAESPSSPDSQTSTASYSPCPRLPITYNEAALSCLQGRQQVIICNNLPIPFPSNSECSTDDTDGIQSPDNSDDTDGSPAEVEADSSCQQIESLTAGRGTNTYTPRCPVDQKQGPTSSRSSKEDTLTTADKVPHRQQVITRPDHPHYRTTESCFQDHPVY